MARLSQQPYCGPERKWRTDMLQAALGHKGISFSQQPDVGSGCLISFHSWGTEAQRSEGTLPQSGVSPRELGESRGSGFRRTRLCDSVAV